MTYIEERKSELRPKISVLYQEIQERKSQLDIYNAEILQLVMLELADEFPQIMRFTFTAEMEYDDEGGYFWSPNFESDPEIDEDDWTVHEALREEGFDEEQVALAFMSTNTYEGEITVIALRGLHDPTLRIPESGTQQKGDSHGLS